MFYQDNWWSLPTAAHIPNMKNQIYNKVRVFISSQIVVTLVILQDSLMSFLMGSIETAIVTISGAFVAPVITTFSVLFSSICRVEESRRPIALRNYRWLCIILFLIIMPLIWFASWYSVADKYPYSDQALCYIKIICISILGFSFFNINRYYSVLNGENNNNIKKAWSAVVLNAVLTAIFCWLFKFLGIASVYSIAFSTVIISFYLAHVTFQKDQSQSEARVSINNLVRILKNGGVIALSVLFEIAMFSIAPVCLAVYGVEQLVIHQYFYVISTVAIIFAYGASVSAIYFVSARLSTGYQYLRSILAILQSKILYIITAIIIIMIICIGLFYLQINVVEFLFILALFCIFDALQIVSSGILRGYGKDKYVSRTYFSVYSLVMIFMFFNIHFDISDNQAVNLWFLFSLAMMINALTFFSYIVILHKRIVP